VRITQRRTIVTRSARAVYALLVLAVLASSSCNRSKTADAAAPPEIAEVERRDLEIRAEASGLIEPVRIVEVKSKASGEVLRLNVETGTDVKRGTLLAEIDPRDVRNAYAQAEADLEVAQARLGTSEAQFKRTEALRKGGAVTEQELEAASLEAANARAQLIKARTSLQLARERLSDVTIRAPIDGTVIEKTVEMGTIIASASQNISGGTTLMKMADLGEMQMRALVDETDIGRVQPGQSARVSVEAYPDRAFIGQVVKIEPQAIVEQNVTMFPVLIRLDNRERALRPGMNADVSIEIARRQEVVTVPNAAVVNPRDAMAAGGALGLSEDEMRAVMRGPGGGGGGTAGDRAGVSASASAGENRSGAGAQPPAVTGNTGEAGAGAAQAGAGAQAGGRRGTRGAGAEGAFAGRGSAGAGGATAGGGRAGGAGAPAGRSSVRPALVFVSTPQGPQPRRVMLGLGDYDFTEVMRGVEPGEKVMLMSVAMIQQKQEEMQRNIRARASGGMFGGGGAAAPAGGAPPGPRP
jgi:HlyD family secretion protein